MTRLFWLGVSAFIVVLVLCAIAVGHLPAADKAPEALTLGSVILVGLALVVVLMILLIVFYKVTGIEDKTQALGLPSGSVRALLAFCLVLMFVCLGVFLYQGVNAPGIGTQAQRIPQEDVDKLKSRFTAVLVKPAMDTTVTPAATDSTGKITPAKTETTPALDKDTKKPLFDVTYFPDRSQQADDFAKQIFTQLATVFVTVIGFYFGSSTAAAGVGAGVAAAGGSTPKPPSTGDGVPAALMEVKAAASDALAEQKQAQAALDSLTNAKEPDATKLSKAKDALQEIQKTIDAIQAQLEIAKTAAAKYGTAPTDAENAAAAAALFKARDTIKTLAATVKTDTDSVAALLKTA